MFSRVLNTDPRRTRHALFILSRLPFFALTSPLSRLFPHAVIVPFLFLPAARLTRSPKAAARLDDGGHVAVAGRPKRDRHLGPAAHNAAVSGFSNAPNGDDVPRFAFAALVAKAREDSIAGPNVKRIRDELRGVGESASNRRALPVGRTWNGTTTRTPPRR